MFNFYNFLRRLFTEYSDASGQKGTVVDEMAVKPTGLVLTDFYNTLVLQRKINNIDNWADLTEAELDRLGNKLFLPRIQGDISHGYVRIYFDAKEIIDITTDFRAASSEGLLYKASQPREISRNSYTEILDSDVGKYYIDIIIESLFDGDTYNIETADIVTLSGINFNYKKVSNPEAIEGGAKHETNEEYFNRIRYSVNDRSMMNKRSIFAKLKEFFPFINSIYVAGSGDKYMDRDIVQARDLSIPDKKAEFLGKITGDNTVNNSAYFGIFPPEAGTRPALFNGPFSIYSDFEFPLTIEGTSPDSSDPAYHGYPLSQEADAEMYQGLYFDDYKNFMEIETVDLFNIIDEDIGLADKITPNEDWVIGAHGKGNGDYGVLEEGLSKIDIIKFNGDDITLGAGSDSPITVSKDISKRTGIKVTGVFNTPTAVDDNATSLHSDLQFMVGGLNGSTVDGFVGIGFGVRLHTVPDASPSIHNASIYFAHSEMYGSGQVFAATDDLISSAGHVSVANLNALAERTTRITPNSEYSFEFVIYDNLSLSLVIDKVNPIGVDPDDIFDDWQLPATILNVFSQQINNTDSTHYGETLKVTLNTQSDDNADKWVVSDLKAMDLAPHRANSLFIFDVSSVEDPLTIVYRGSGQSAISGALGSGYSVYIWDTEKESPEGGETVLSLGGWTQLEDVSNPSGAKDSIAENLTHNLSNIDQYKVESRYGDAIILLATTTGTSLPKLKIRGETIEDIQSLLLVDYIQIRSQNVDTYHAKNKADIYVNTVKNSDSLEVVETVITKGPDESLFLLNEDSGFKMPIADIQTVSINSGGIISEELSDSDYTVVRDDTHNLNSTSETIKLSVDNSSVNDITVEYSVYKDVARIQDFYDSAEYGKVLGNILVKHKYPCLLDISLFYTGDTEKEDLIDAIRDYVDDNSDGTFITSNLVSHLYNEKLVNNVKEPIEIFYTKTEDDLSTTTGSFTDSLTIRPIDFFRIDNISVDKL